MLASSGLHIKQTPNTPAPTNPLPTTESPEKEPILPRDYAPAEPLDRSGHGDGSGEPPPAPSTPTPSTPPPAPRQPQSMMFKDLQLSPDSFIAQGAINEETDDGMGGTEPARTYSNPGGTTIVPPNNRSGMEPGIHEAPRLPRQTPGVGGGSAPSPGNGAGRGGGGTNIDDQFNEDGSSI